MALLDVEAVDTYYGRVQALHGVSLTIDEGEIVTLIGSNGAGKTTTLRTISGLARPARGHVRLRGVEIAGLAPDRVVMRGIGHAPEGRRVFARMSVRDNLFLGAYIRKPFLERVAFNKKNILRRDGYTCQYCSRRGEKLTVDHVVPRSRGGQTTWTNVVAACLRCNLLKGNRTLEEARLRLIREPVHPQFLFSVHLLRHPHATSFLDSWRKYLVAVPSTS